MVDERRTFADIIAERVGDQLVDFREMLAELLACGFADEALDYKLHTKQIEAATVANSSITVAVTLAVHSAEFMGTFAPAQDPKVIVVTLIRGTGLADDLPIFDSPMPLAEQEGWVFAVLGSALYDYAYKVITGPMLIRERPTCFAVITDGEGYPMLAPEDFQWHSVGSGGPATRLKLSPKSPSDTLAHTLLHTGDVTPLNAPGSSSSLSDRDWADQFATRLQAEFMSATNTDDVRFGQVIEFTRRIGSVSWMWRTRMGREGHILLDLAAFRHDLRTRFDRHTVGGAINYTMEHLIQSTAPATGGGWVRIGDRGIGDPPL